MKTSILIVEDDIIVANNLRDRLAALGHAVCGITSSGLEAIERTAESQPDLILMDIKLRGEMDGIACAHEIRSRYDIPVVYLTGYADEQTLQRAKLSDPYGYILKPFEVRDLHTTIEMALHKHVMEKRIRESEEKYRSLVEYSLQGIMVIQDMPPRIIFANAPCAEIIGYSADELMNLPAQRTLDLIHPEDQEWLLQRLTDHASREAVPATGRCVGSSTLPTSSSVRAGRPYKQRLSTSPDASRPRMRCGKHTTGLNRGWRNGQPSLRTPTGA
jgi:CheY-like chemotaxis protein